MNKQKTLVGVFVCIFVLFLSSTGIAAKGGGRIDVGAELDALNVKVDQNSTSINNLQDKLQDLLNNPVLQNVTVNPSEYREPMDAVKTFAIRELGGVTNTQIWTNEPIDSDHRSLLIEDVNRASLYRYFYVEDADGIKLESVQNAGAGGEPTTYDHPWLVSPSKSVPVGFTWGDAYYDQNFNTETVKYTILGVEDVTVEFGIGQGTTYYDCLKIMRERGKASDRVVWRAKGIGIVKFVYTTQNYQVVGYLE